MKQIIKKLVVISCIAISLLLVLTVNTYAKEAKSTVTYQLKDGVLTIKGKGDMPNDMTFKKNESIKEVIIKKGVTSIPYKAFYKCKNFKKVKIANTVKKIEALAFAYTGVKKLNIPKSVDVFEEYALAYCKNLKTLTMPGNFDVDIYGDGMVSAVIYDCNKLKTVNFNTNFSYEIAKYCGGKRWNVLESDPNYKSIDGIIYTKDGKELVRVPIDRKILKVAKGCEVFCFQAVLYPKEFDDGGWDLEAGCCDLEKIVLPKSIRTIDNKKYNAYPVDEPILMRLETLKIKSSKLDTESIKTLVSTLKKIYSYDNKKIYKFANIEVIYKMIPSIEKNGDFYILNEDCILGYSGDKETVIVPEGIKIIPDNLFDGSILKNNKNIKKIILPESIEEIGERAFYKCKNLEEINLPESIKKVGDEAFAKTGVRKIEIPGKVAEWGRSIFSNSYLQEVTIPETMTLIPAYMFSDCKSLSKVNIVGNITTIKNHAFAYTSVDIQSIINIKTLSTIEAGAFYNVYWTELTIPEHIEYIGSFAFASNVLVIRVVNVEGDATRYYTNMAGDLDHTLTINYKH